MTVDKLDAVLIELQRQLSVVRDDSFMGEGIMLDNVELPTNVVGSAGDLEVARRLLEQIEQEIDRLTGIKVRLAGELADLRCRGKFRFSAPETFDTLA